MLDHYRYFAQGRIAIDAFAVSNYLYVRDLFENRYFCSAEHYTFLAKASNTKLIKALLC